MYVVLKTKRNYKLEEVKIEFPPQQRSSKGNVCMTCRSKTYTCNADSISNMSKWKEIEHSAYEPLETAMLKCINQHSKRGASSGISFASMQFLCIRYGPGFWNFCSWLAYFQQQHKIHEPDQEADESEFW